MGWTSYHAEFYKNGKVDRLKEIEQQFEKTEGYKVLKASLVGSVVYLGIEKIKEDKKTVFASIFLTSVEKDNYYNFSYKEMDESCGPYYYDCPASILKLLSPTDSKLANEWRESCWKKIEEKKNRKKDPNSLSNLPVGSRIEMKYWEENTPTIILKKIKHGAYKNPIWVKEDLSARFTTKTIQTQGYSVL